MLSLLSREFRLFWRNKVFVVAFCLMPVVLALVLGSVYQQGRVTHLPIVVVDKDHTALSTTLGDMLAENPTLHVVATTSETVDLHQVLLAYRAVAVIIIPYRFEADLLAQKRPEVNCYLSMANSLTAGVAGSAIMSSTGTLNAGVLITSLQKKGVPSALASQQVDSFQLNLFSQFNRSGNYLLYLWPGLIFAILHQLLLLAMAVSFSQEIVNHHFTVAALLQGRPSAGRLLLLKALPYLIFSLATLGSYFLLGAYFHIPAPAHSLVSLAAVLLLLVSTCLLGMLFSLVSPTPLKATQTLMSVASPAFTISGFSWPTGQEPAFLRALSATIPLTPFLKSFRLTLLQGASWAEVAPYLGHQLLLTLVYLGLGLYVLRAKMTKALRSAQMPPLAATT